VECKRVSKRNVPNPPKKGISTQWSNITKRKYCQLGEKASDRQDTADSSSTMSPSNLVNYAQLLVFPEKCIVKGLADVASSKLHKALIKLTLDKESAAEYQDGMEYVFGHTIGGGSGTALRGKLRDLIGPFTAYRIRDLIRLEVVVDVLFDGSQAVLDIMDAVLKEQT